MRITLLTGIAIVALLAGCDTNGPSPARTTARISTPRPAIVVTRDDGSLPRRCGVRRTASRVVDFFDAFNRGDAAALDGLIADRQHFQWYSSTEGHGKRSRTFSTTGVTSDLEGPRGGPPSRSDGRPALLRYLVDRSKRGERLHLVQVKVTRIAPRSWVQSITDDVAGVEYSVRLDAPDLAGFRGRNRLAGGKGGFGCFDGRLLVWSMGLDTAGGRTARAARLCRVTARIQRPTRRVLACSG